MAYKFVGQLLKHFLHFSWQQKKTFVRARLRVLHWFIQKTFYFVFYCSMSFPDCLFSCTCIYGVLGPCRFCIAVHDLLELQIFEPKSVPTFFVSRYSSCKAPSCWLVCNSWMSVFHKSILTQVLTLKGTESSDYCWKIKIRKHSVAILKLYAKTAIYTVHNALLPGWFQLGHWLQSKDVSNHLEQALPLIMCKESFLTTEVSCSSNLTCILSYNTSFTTFLLKYTNIKILFQVLQLCGKCRKTIFPWKKYKYWHLFIVHAIPIRAHALLSDICLANATTEQDLTCCVIALEHFRYLWKQMFEQYHLVEALQKKYYFCVAEQSIAVVTHTRKEQVYLNIKSKRGRFKNMKIKRKCVKTFFSIVHFSNV